MRLLGIDYGTKRVGIALSDDGGRLAFPHVVLHNNAELLSEIQYVVETYSVEKIVIGESKDYQMKDNLIMQEARDFVEDLEDKVEATIVFHPEFMSSVQVEKTIFEAHKEEGRHMKKEQKAKQIDAQAAAIILQSYIDSLNT